MGCGEGESLLLLVLLLWVIRMMRGKLCGQRRCGWRRRRVQIACHEAAAAAVVRSFELLGCLASGQRAHRRQRSIVALSQVVPDFETAGVTQHRGGTLHANEAVAAVAEGGLRMSGRGAHVERVEGCQ